MFDAEKIRKDFPILSASVYGRPLVYLDNAATAQKPQCVIDAMDGIYETVNGNIHRGVHFMAGRCTELYEAARSRIAGWIGAAAPEEIVFTSGATASVNLVAYSYGLSRFSPGDNIIVSQMEHHSNLVPWQIAAAMRGTEIRCLPFDAHGALQIEKLAELLDSRTRLVAVTQCSNVLGSRPDVRRIADMAHACGAVVLVDGCQGVVHSRTDVQSLGCDFYVFSGHKLYGPTGTGVLYGRAELLQQMPPFMGGGDMVDRVSFAGTTYAEAPLRFEAGTPNYVGVIGLGRAVEYLAELDMQAAVSHEDSLRRYAEQLLEQIPGITIYGRQQDKAPVISFNAEGVHHYDLGMILDKLGIAVRTGMHCAEPVMTRCGVSGMCRASMAFYNTRAEAEALAAGVERAVKMLRK